MTEKVKRTKSKGNVFRDLGFERPDEWAAKAQIAAHVLRVIEDRGLTQAAAAKILGVSQPEVSNLKHGQFDRFTIDRLFRFLAALDQHVEISIGPQANAATKDSVTVHAP